MRKHEEGLGGIHEVAKCCKYSEGAVDDGRTIILLDLGLTFQCPQEHKTLLPSLWSDHLERLNDDHAGYVPHIIGLWTRFAILISDMQGLN